MILQILMIIIKLFGPNPNYGWGIFCGISDGNTGQMILEHKSQRLIPPNKKAMVPSQVTL